MKRIAFVDLAVAFAGILTVTGQPVGAEEMPHLATGNRLRIHGVTSSASPTTVLLLAIHHDSLVTIKREEGTIDWIAVRDIETVEAYAGQKSRWATGARIGLLVGAVAGGIIGYGTTLDGWYEGIGMIPGVLIGAGAGFLGGSAVGASIKTDSWTLVPRESMQAITVRSVGAEEIARMRAGDRLGIQRVTHSGTSTEVYVLANRTDSILAVEREEGGDVDWIAIRDVDNVEAHVEQKGHSTLGAAIGTLAGAAVGAALDDITTSDEHKGAAFGAMAGLLCGAVVGGSIKTDTWGDAPRDHMQLSINAHRRVGFGLAMTWRF